METPEAPVLSLPELVEPLKWQRLQDHFANVLGIMLRTVSPTHALLTSPSWPSSFDAERAIRLLHIGDELEQLLPVGAAPLSTSSLTTPLGITYAAVPMRPTPGPITSYIVVGPVVVGPREDEVKFFERVTAMGMDAASLWSVLLSLKLYTFASIRSALNLLEEVGSSIVELAYQAKQISSLFPPTSRINQAVVAHHTDHIVRSLLEAATLATKADGGSVMMYDARSSAFQLKAAQGLSREIVEGLRVKRGEGIAGLVATQRNILLVDDHISDERIKRRMTRPDVVSSIVAPISLDANHDPIGVLSLRTMSAQRRFTQEHVEVLRPLLDLAYLALNSLGTFFAEAQTQTPS